jgi:hypothetical protein
MVGEERFGVARAAESARPRRGLRLHAVGTRFNRANSSHQFFTQLAQMQRELRFRSARDIRSLHCLEAASHRVEFIGARTGPREPIKQVPQQDEHPSEHTTETALAQ